MRKSLKQLCGKRMRFRGVIDRYGWKKDINGNYKETILLKNICLIESDDIVTDHVWFTCGKTISSDLPIGSVIEFDARVAIYMKGYKNSFLGINNRKKDYKLSNPTKLKLIA